jgi:hypothetical protein
MTSIPAGACKPPPWWVANSKPDAEATIAREWPKVLAEFGDYPGMLMAFRARAAERQIAISSDETHHVAGLSDRRITQLLSLRTLRNIQSVRRIGILSLGPLLGVLGVKLVMVEDVDAIKRHGERIKARNNNLVHGGVVQHTQSLKFLRKIGKKGGKARLKTMNAKRRSASARKAAFARWNKASIAAATRAAGTSPKAAPPAARPQRRPRNSVPAADRSRAAPPCASMPVRD